MNMDNPKNWKRGVEHPPEDDLLCYIDGELSQNEADEVRSHLEACWDCRNRAEKFQSAISLFIDYRSQVLRPLTEAPTNWRGFDSKLQRQAAEPIPPTFWERWRTALGRLHSTMPHAKQRTLRLAMISSVTLLLIFGGVYLIFVSGPAVVSAEQLIDRAYAAREAEIKNTDQPVLYQQLRVRRHGYEGEATATVEIWQDVENLRIRRVVAPQSGSENVIGDVEHILKANNYAPPPLSIVGFKGWRDGLPDKQDSVEAAKLDDGQSGLRLTTESKADPQAGAILTVTLLVRASDFHPIEQQMRVLADDGIQEYEFRETSFAVMSLNSLNVVFFNDSMPMVVLAKPKPSASTDGSPGSNANESALIGTKASPDAVGSTDLEVDVLNMIHNAGADLGEQIEVRRTVNGPVIVSGVVDTVERKDQIIKALSPVANNPAVRIQITTVAEYLAYQKQGSPTPRPSVESVEVEGDMFPAESELRKHFNDNAAVKAFATRMTTRSSQAMNYLWAMKRLKGQFSQAELEKLSPEARSKWLSVLRSYARSYESEIATLKNELQPVFGGKVNGGTQEVINTDAELLSAIDQLFAAGSRTNKDIRAALTTSSSGVNVLKSTEFWQQLSRAEALAVSIDRAK
jgi:hypothetical protein